MAQEEKEYQQVFKATSLFGGVQIFQILLSVVKSKITAILLGPSGMGIIRLLNSSIGLIGEFSSFGLPLSSVKHISLKFMSGDVQKTYKLIAILKKLLWITGLLGGAIMIIAAPFLSRLLFDSEAYTFSFIWVAIVVLFNQLTNGRISILQSLRKLGQLAKANLLGSALALIIVAPLYYFFRKDAIVPAIIITALINFYFSWYYLKKNKIPKISLGYKESVVEGKDMLKLGLVLSFSGLMASLTAYLLQIYINEVGGVDQVGLYSAGFLILNTYGGLIFSAMGKDYYPRLSGISDNNPKVREAVKHQAFIAILLMTPIIVVFLALAPQLINVLFSSKFSGIEQMISWGILGLLFKAVSWSMGYVIIAKGDSKVFTKTTVIFNVLQLSMNIGGYYIAGLTGVGISFLAYYIIHFIAVYAIDHFRYDFYFPTDFYLIFAACILFCGAAFGLTYLDLSFWRYFLLGFTALLSGLFSYYYLNKKINFVELLTELFKNRRSKK